MRARKARDAPKALTRSQANALMALALAAGLVGLVGLLAVAALAAALFLPLCAARSIARAARKSKKPRR